jgi:hypothetical protein
MEELLESSYDEEDKNQWMMINGTRKRIGGKTPA